MFVRGKRRGSRVFYYLVSNERHEGRVRQKTLLYLGVFESVQAAHEGLQSDIAELQVRIDDLFAKANEWKKKIDRLAFAYCPCRDGIPIYTWRLGNQLHDPARQYWRYQKEAESLIRWQRNLIERLDKVKSFTSLKRRSAHISF